MGTNRWIGQAVAVRESRHYVPRNVSAGSRFQLADGVRRINYSYPVVAPEVDATTEDKARRVVEALVALANSESGAGLSGGTSSDYTYSVSSYNGSPAVRVDGSEDGSTIGITADTVGPTTTPVLVQQMQAGSAGADYVFTLTWPVVPTLGSWTIAADGKAPVLLAYNVNAAGLQAAIAAFGLPCASVSVTGSHILGYTVSLVAPTEAIEYPPILFPITPGAGVVSSITMELYENRSYRFGPNTEGYDVDDGIFEPDITDVALEAYLASPYRMGALAADINITMTARPASINYLAGQSMSITFTTIDAYNAFVAMEKSQFIYSYTEVTYFSTAAGLHTYGLAVANTTTRKKLLQFPHYKDGTPEDLNPFRRQYYSKSFVTGALPDYLFNTGVSGYDPALTSALVQTGSLSGTSLTINLDYLFSDSFAVSWNIPQDEVFLYYGTIDAPTAWPYTIVSGGGSSESGVNNNAGYKVTTVGIPGIINQEMLMGLLDGDINSLYQFSDTASGKVSHYFNGIASLTMLRDAAQALWGAANVTVAAGPEGYAARLIFTGALAELAVEAAVLKTGGEPVALTVDVESATPMQPWVLRYQFTGGVCAGSWKIIDSVSPVVSQTAIPWLSTTEITPAFLLARFQEMATSYTAVLEESDITVVTEEVGTKFILREFTVSFAAQPSAGFVASETPIFWFGLDTSLLLTAEPTIAIISEGRTAQSEVQLVTVQNAPTSGNWTLTYNGTPTVSLAYNATAAAVQAAIITVSSACSVIGSDGGPYRVIWTAKATQYLMVGVAGTLAGSASPSFDTIIAAGTGASHFDNADNWSLGTVPAADTIVFDSGSVPCKYGLSTSAAIVAIDIYRSYGGAIGLPEVRSDGSLETQARFLTVSGAGSAIPIRVGLGGSGVGPDCIRIDTGVRTYKANILYTQSGLSNKVCVLKGSSVSNTMIVAGGDVACGIRPEDVANLLTLKLTPSTADGDDVLFSSSSASDVKGVFMSGGDADFGEPPESIVMLGGTAAINGTGDTLSIDASNARVRWLADGTICPGQAATAVLFGPSLLTSTSSGTPLAVRITKAAHGLVSGQKVYVRAYSGVQGLDGEVYAVSVVDSSNFDLIGSSAYGTLTGYAGLVSFALASQIIIRQGAVLDFDSEGRQRDIVPPIIVQGTGIVSDSKATVTDLRLWPEQVEALAYLGQSVEIRRSLR